MSFRLYILNIFLSRRFVLLASGTYTKERSGWWKGDQNSVGVSRESRVPRTVLLVTVTEKKKIEISTSPTLGLNSPVNKFGIMTFSCLNLGLKSRDPRVPLWIRE